MDPRWFDIKAYLDDRGVKYYEEGKNIGSGDIGLSCIFCGDKSTHMGIKLTTKRVYCWICGGHSIFKLIATIDGIPFPKVDSVMSKFILPGGPYIAHDVIYDTRLPYPLEAQPLLAPHYNYLKLRNFNPEIIVSKYKIKACWNVGDYKWRIIIPIIMQGRLGGFTSRDITDSSPLRYKNQPKGQSPIPQEEWIYNIDTIDRKAILVEGPTDVWRLGEGSISLLGINPTHEQIGRLSELDQVFILFDSEDKAQKRAEELAGNLASLPGHVEVVTTDKEGDPGDYTEDEAREMRKELL